MIKYIFEPSISFLIKSNNMINQGIKHKILWQQSRNFKYHGSNISAKEFITVNKKIDNTEVHKFVNKQSETNIEKIKQRPTKDFLIKSNIAIRDLIIKINNMNKALKKKHRVKICFQHPDGIQEEVLNNVRQKIQGTLLTQRSKKICTIFTYSPLLNNTDTSSENNKE